jgi:hypothetical protein
LFLAQDVDEKLIEIQNKSLDDPQQVTGGQSQLPIIEVYEPESAENRIIQV